MDAEDTPSVTPTPHGRAWRLAFRANALVSMALAALLAVLANVLLDLLPPLRGNVSSAHGYYRLSDKTLALLHGLEQEVEVVSLFNPRHDFYADVRTLLREYEYESRRGGQGRLAVRFVDPHRDVARTREMKQRYSLATADMVVFDAGGRVKYVSAQDIVEEQRTVDVGRHMAGAPGAVQTATLFHGEQAFSSAIQNVSQKTRPVVYALTGHGEADIADYSEQAGYGGIARIMRRDNMEVRPLDMGRHGGIPEDASVLLVAGPTRHLAREEVDIIGQWLNRSGRLFLLLDPWTRTGLEDLMATWGVRLDMDAVQDPARTLTGRELVFRPLPTHDIGRPLRNIGCIFYGARSVEPLPAHDALQEDVQADKARVYVLARTSEKAWAERDPAQKPPRYDADTDRPGPIGLAAAVEKGPVTDTSGDLSPTRIVVFGDSVFVSNPALAVGAGGNVDLFMSALNWLADREELMALAPKIPERIELGMTRDRMRQAFLIVVFAAPTLVALIGGAVWWRRRR